MHVINVSFDSLVDYILYNFIQLRISYFIIMEHSYDELIIWLNVYG